MLKLASHTRINAQVRGAVLEGIARDFIRELLPPTLRLKSGLISDTKSKKISPQCDAIIYDGVPLLEFTDIVVVEKEQVKAIVEVKAYIDQADIFGAKSGENRDPNTGLASAFNRYKDFRPAEASYILFAFELYSSSSDDEVLERLKKICDSYAIVLRYEPKKEQKPNIYNFDNSISRLIEWLRNLS
ncbi:hypothetical protein ES707_19036 [subsurface metagenome]